MTKSSVDLRITTLPDAVYDVLREQIMSGVEAPGSLVTETAIAERFGVARPTAKVALERLVSEGILKRRAHKAAYVPILTRDDIKDVYYSRAILESEAVRTLAYSRKVPDEAAAAQAELRKQASQPGGALARADIAFHRALVTAQPSSRLARMHQLLMGEMELCTGQVQAQRLVAIGDIIDQHQGILDAIISGDPELTAHRAREHVEKARDRLLAKIDRDQTTRP